MYMILEGNADLVRMTGLHEQEMGISIIMCATETTKSQSRSLPIIPLDLHDGRLLVGEADLAFFVETSASQVADESARHV